MGDEAYTAAISDARSVASAGRELLRAIQQDVDVAGAADELEIRAQRVISVSVHGFESAMPGEPDSEDLLAVALSRLEIGNTLLAAQTTLDVPAARQRLKSAVQSLAGTADALELQAFASVETHRFDALEAKAMGVRDAACAALDEMSAGAAGVATTLLDTAVKPVTNRFPVLADLLSDQMLNIPGRLARVGLLAVRGGLKLLADVVKQPRVEQARSQIEEVLARLGQGEDGLVLASWAIGADSVRDRLAALSLPDDAGLAGVADDLARLTQGWAKVCQLLRRVATLLVSLAATLALLHAAIPQTALLTMGLLALVAAAVVVLGRDYTGAGDLPGRVRGVLLVAVGEASVSGRSGGPD